ncbi:MAG: hypothetical protein V7734_00230 [Maribacter arcticus]|uniref:hypothetical protein n=1 Tax=Maribacter arcticus TaxID=561365 RepID=UPI0030031208
METVLAILAAVGLSLGGIDNSNEKANMGTGIAKTYSTYQAGTKANSKAKTATEYDTNSNIWGY